MKDHPRMMNFSKASSLALLVFLLIIVASCARVVYKPEMVYGPSEARWER